MPTLALLMAVLACSITRMRTESGRRSSKPSGGGSFNLARRLTAWPPGMGIMGRVTGFVVAGPVAGVVLVGWPGELVTAGVGAGWVATAGGGECVVGGVP